MPIPNAAPCPLVQLRARAQRCWASPEQPPVGPKHGHGTWWGSRSAAGGCWQQEGGHGPCGGLSSPLRSLCCGQRLRRVLARLRIYRTHCTEVFLLQSFGIPDKGLIWCFQKRFAPYSSTLVIQSSPAAALHPGAAAPPSPACLQPAGAVPVRQRLLQGAGPSGELHDSGLLAAFPCVREVREH